MSNTGSSACGSRALDWFFADGQRITQLWNAEYVQSGSAVTVKNVGWNGNVAPGSSVGFGFTGSWSGANAKPTAFGLEGRNCAVS
ncbi:cellulose binding domain-containing protein [Streptomyces sp. Marseille-Q5077]|uniref:cellulose binding domain-containing protein n=1 Tax=Streptomyces sp. Marseille-Q5077 TaxID=3418995 RepID=UPI003D094F60